MPANPRWEYKSGLVSGYIESNGQCLTSKAFDARDGSPLGDVLLPYRLLTRNGWHGEAREMSHRMTVLPDGVEVRWDPCASHPAALCITTRLTGPGIFDVQVEVSALAQLPQYELFFSSYFAKALRSGGYVASLPAESPVVPGWTQVFPAADALFREMYIAFPRDEAGAERICDGRWQRGRHFTRFLPARYYAEPFAFYHNPAGDLSASILATRGDAYAVSMAYKAEDQSDGVGQHNSQYMSLFGRDLQAGETAHARLRFVVDDSGADAKRHKALFDAFVQSAGTPA